MSIPGFTAEATVETTRERYVFAPKATAEAGSVQPQGLYVNPNGDIVYCDNYVGCFVVRRKLKLTHI